MTMALVRSQLRTFLVVQMHLHATTILMPPLTMVHVSNWTSAAFVEERELLRASVIAKATFSTNAASAVVKALLKVNATVTETS